MVPEEFGLGGFSSLLLRCAGEIDPHRHVRKVTAALLPALADPPDLLVVQGDTSSALGAALAGFAAGVPVAHVEAGLRTHDPALPWPEEEYRTAIDAGAELLFAPTGLSARNLADEGVPGKIHVTGNTSIDAVLEIAKGLPPANGGMPNLLVTCHRRESWREGLGSIAGALKMLADDGHARVDFVLHPNRHVSATMESLLHAIPNLQLLQPCVHRELIRRMRDATLILSDSGGMQEEAPALGIPLLVLREKTERPEGIATGNMRLVGTAAGRIVDETREILGNSDLREAMSRPAFPYGDGRAADRIALHIEDWLSERQA